ncbi:putative small nuclear ribonucleoprotein G isoform X1 [Gossypium australe]|uniref:Small nuclear ribonucleoprotein G n=1 Tax=Gossypium australe TaxID=47621 RepID=A0A5B6V445_9ROSI|nr:putative small nuclear ribonucleoprotein G isoform X1 [Gossypium australe]
MSRSGQPPDLKKYAFLHANFNTSLFFIRNISIANLYYWCYLYATGTWTNNSRCLHVQESITLVIIEEFTADSCVDLVSCPLGGLKLNANRMVVGTLRGFDQFMNLVVDNTVEVNGNEKNDIGMVVIRGNSVVTVEALEPVGRMQ